MENALNTLNDFVVTYGLKIVGAILILIIGRIVAGWVRKGVKKALNKSNVDVALVSFFGHFAYFVVIMFVILAALAKFGIQTASFVAILGAAGFAVGFALQGSLSNFAAGVMILAFRPFKIGDYVDAGGIAGTVKEIQLFTTVLATPDNVKVIAPNGAVFGSYRVRFAYTKGEGDHGRDNQERFEDIGRPADADRGGRAGRLQRELRGAYVGEEGRLLGSQIRRDAGDQGGVRPGGY
jgi:small conductance mechanosensitive channel